MEGLKEQLEQLQKNLEASVSEKSKTQVAAEFAAFTEKFNKANEEAKTELQGQFNDLKKEFNEFNAQAATILKFGRGEAKEKSFSEQVADNVKIKGADIAALKNNRGASVSFDIKAVGTITTANYSGGNVGLTAWDGEIGRLVRREPFLRQIVSVRPMGEQGIAWAEMANPEGGAGMTAEGALKSQYDFDMVERREVAKKITAYTKATKEALQDLPSLQALINQELVDIIELKLDEQMLTGDNTGQNLKGISAYATAFSVATTALALGVTRANRYDVLRAAAWQIANLGKGRFVPNYALVNPIDAAVMDLTKTADGIYVAPPFTTAQGQTIAGLRVIANTGVAAGDFYVGDFRKVILGIREEININIGYENDDFTKNLVTILAEMRAAQYVKTNDAGSIVKGTFGTAITALNAA